jgi:hypothetical protein
MLPRSTRRWQAIGITAIRRYGAEQESHLKSTLYWNLISLLIFKPVSNQRAPEAVGLLNIAKTSLLSCLCLRVTETALCR